MKYLIVDNGKHTSEIVEARKKPIVDPLRFSVKRIREKIIHISSNQRKKQARLLKNSK